MITKFDEYTLIKESPDHINDVDGKYLYVTDRDSRGFFIDPNEEHTKVKKLYVSSEGQFHSDMGPYHSYPGRLWKKSKVMTFWVYPNPVLFKDIIQRLEKRLRIKILNNGWKVEVVKSKDGEVQTRDVSAADFKFSDVNWGKAELIPIEEYVGSEDFSEEEQIMHLMNWKDREAMKKSGKYKIPRGFGSDKTAFDQPKNIKWRQAMYQEKKNNE